MELPPEVQRHLAAYTSNAGIKARRGDRFLGRERTVGDEMRRCVCGLCVQTRGAPQTSCTLFAEGGARVVERQQTELCKPVCISRNSISMMQRVIRSLLRGVAALRENPDGFIRVSLQREEAVDVTPETPPSSEPYLFDADFFDGELQGSFFLLA